jgi:hypothetical protein
VWSLYINLYEPSFALVNTDARKKKTKHCTSFRQFTSYKPTIRTILELYNEIASMSWEQGVGMGLDGFGNKPRAPKCVRPRL